MKPVPIFGTGFFCSVHAFGSLRFEAIKLGAIDFDERSAII